MGLFGNSVARKREALTPKYRAVYKVGGKVVATSGDYDTYAAAMSDTRGFQGDRVLKKNPRGKVVAEIQMYDGRWLKVGSRTLRRK